MRPTVGAGVGSGWLAQGTWIRLRRRSLEAVVISLIEAMNRVFDLCQPAAVTARQFSFSVEKNSGRKFSGSPSSTASIVVLLVQPAPEEEDLTKEGE